MVYECRLKGEIINIITYLPTKTLTFLKFYLKLKFVVKSSKKFFLEFIKKKLANNKFLKTFNNPFNKLNM